ncbi:uracil-DNA glycosylase [Rhizobium sp. G21]|uniref:uracil-DNA glycosylase n=1 Tax=Rhizobium sp. G21 TaxID=2758439 RepID=UPI0016002ED7|nr:uracil-DNA glycosylase [Rhizobium sp. G21]MBB1250082.1 uracil-DNA glycosylase [Rhizobium sp. G21]
MTISSPIDALSPAELGQLMHFYAESGVEWLLEDEPVDRFAEFERQVAERGRAAATETRVETPPRDRNAAPAPIRPAALPDGEAVSEAQRVASAAQSVAELIEAVSAFTGCNLRNSARASAFFKGSTSAKIAIAGGCPGPDDDRHGAPFSGAHGDMLDRMIAALGWRGDDVAVFNVIPWRPPGNRAPTPHEVEICRPFSTRLVELLRPKALLSMGNFPARFFSGSQESIHSLRGRWIALTVDGQHVPLLPTFHPQDLISAPACKRLAWQDLLNFKLRLSQP